MSTTSVNAISSTLTSSISTLKGVLKNKNRDSFTQQQQQSQSSLSHSSQSTHQHSHCQSSGVLLPASTTSTPFVLPSFACSTPSVVQSPGEIKQLLESFMALRSEEKKSRLGRSRSPQMGGVCSDNNGCGCECKQQLDAMRSSMREIIENNPLQQRMAIRIKELEKTIAAQKATIEEQEKSSFELNEEIQSLSTKLHDTTAALEAATAAAETKKKQQSYQLSQQHFNDHHQQYSSSLEASVSSTNKTAADDDALYIAGTTNAQEEEEYSGENEASRVKRSKPRWENEKQQQQYSQAKEVMGIQKDLCKSLVQELHKQVMLNWQLEERIVNQEKQSMQSLYTLRNEFNQLQANSIQTIRELNALKKERVADMNWRENQAELTVSRSSIDSAWAITTPTTGAAESPSQLKIKCDRVQAEKERLQFLVDELTLEVDRLQQQQQQQQQQRPTNNSISNKASAIINNNRETYNKSSSSQPKRDN